jgi:shikimate kinase
MNIVLIGFMATGKSAVGRILAERLGWPFYDTDAMIEEQTGLTIPEIFAKKGEGPFRDLETQAIRLLSVLDKIVIATGGGAALRPENMRELERTGSVFCLTARPDTILGRAGDRLNARPLLAGRDPRSAVEKMLRDRAGAYQRCRAAIPTDDLSPEQVADKILALVEGG